MVPCCRRLGSRIGRPYSIPTACLPIETGQSKQGNRSRAIEAGPSKQGDRSRVIEAGEAGPVVYRRPVLGGRCTRSGPNGPLSYKEKTMLFSASAVRRHLWLATVPLLMFVSPGSARAPAPELNPAAIAYKLPSQIQWKDDEMGLKSAVVYGDPSKP